MITMINQGACPNCGSILINGTCPSCWETPSQTQNKWFVNILFWGRDYGAYAAQYDIENNFWTVKEIILYDSIVYQG